MNKLPFISIIIPVYGVEPYIEDCIRSVMAQDYQGPIECILVDDCGLDRSMEIAREVINANSSSVQFRIVRHEQNRGLSAARNTGMREAQGDYCYMLDSDDEITPDCISLLATPLLNRPYDMVIGEFAVLGAEDKYPHLHWEEGARLGHEEICLGYYYRRWFQMSVSKLYSLDFLRKHNQIFLEGVIHEDELWSAELACILESVYVVKKPTYLYKIRTGSITTANNYLKRKAAFHKMIPSFVEFAINNCLFSDSCSLAILDKFAMMFFGVTQLENPSECKQCYLAIRSFFDIHSKWLCVRQKGAFRKFRCFHYCFPPVMGYYVKRFLDWLLKLKAGLSSLFSPLL